MGGGFVDASMSQHYEVVERHIRIAGCDLENVIFLFASKASVV